MPRWLKTPADYDAAIAKSEEKIAKYQQLLESEKNTLVQLEAQKRDVEMQVIYDLSLIHISDLYLREQDHARGNNTNLPLSLI